MNVGDRVELTDPTSTHYGTVVVTGYQDGMCYVKWDSGVTERVHESELLRSEVGAPLEFQPITQADLAVMKEDGEIDGYEKDDPKSESFADRLSSIWDMRPGK